MSVCLPLTPCFGNTITFFAVIDMSLVNCNCFSYSFIFTAMLSSANAVSVDPKKQESINAYINFAKVILAYLI